MDSEKENNVKHFLDLIQKSRRGKFKVYIGMSAGVGKTYRMLQEAHTLLKKGIDIIIKLRNQVPEQYRGFVDPMIMGGLNKLGKSKGKEIEDYITNGMK